MPLIKGKSRATIGANIRELKKGPQYQETQKKFGKAVAHKQTVAIALTEARKAGAKFPMPRKMR